MLCTTHTVRPYHIANFSYHYSLWISIIPNSTLHLSLPMNNYHFGSKLYSETYSSFVSSHYSYLHNTWNLHYSKLHSTSQTYQSTHTRSQGQHYFEPLNEPKKVKLYPKVHKIHKYINTFNYLGSKMQSSVRSFDSPSLQGLGSQYLIAVHIVKYLSIWQIINKYIPCQ